MFIILVSMIKNILFILHLLKNQFFVYVPKFSIIISISRITPFLIAVLKPLTEMYLSTVYVWEKLFKMNVLFIFMLTISWNVIYQYYFQRLLMQCFGIILFVEFKNSFYHRTINTIFDNPKTKVYFQHSKLIDCNYLEYLDHKFQIVKFRKFAIEQFKLFNVCSL